MCQSMTLGHIGEDLQECHYVASKFTCDKLILTKPSIHKGVYKGCC